jgi:hypothetical protein
LHTAAATTTKSDGRTNTPDVDDDDDDPVYHVVLNDKWKPTLESWCQEKDWLRKYCDRIHPIWVDCPEGNFGPSPCCKQEMGLLKVLDDTNMMGRYDWFVYQDDDVYLRAKRLEDFLQPMNDVTYPLLVTSGPFQKNTQVLGQMSYLNEKQRNYTCRTDDVDFQYPWGQPVIYNDVALRYISSGLRLGGLTKQCEEFQVTHDAGNAIIHWMYSIPEVRIRIPLKPNSFQPKSFGVHGVAKKHTREGKRLDEKEYMSMYDVHTEYTKKKREGFLYKYHNATGFRQTRTYSKYGDPSSWMKEWHIMPVSDCNPPPLPPPPTAAD